MPSTVTISLTETQCLTALRAFLLGVLPTGVEVVRGQVNRVAEPQGSDFAIMWPIRMEPLGTTGVTYVDDAFVGSISGAVLTVGTITQNEGPLQAGMVVTDRGGTSVSSGTVLGTQIGGTPGGSGTWNVTPSQTVASEGMFASQANDLGSLEWTVQLDVHGPNSGTNTMLIETLFKEIGSDDSFSASGFDVHPLYCTSRGQMPFMNAEEQYENRWVLELCMQINPVVSRPQQFADQLHVTLTQAGVVGPATN